MDNNELSFDKASYRNRGGLLNKLITKYKIWRYNIQAGEGNVIKASAEFRLTDNAYLQIGNNCTIQDYVFFQLTKPNPVVIIGNNVSIGRNNIISAKNKIIIGDNTLIGSYVQIMDNEHKIAKDELIINQKALILETIIGKDCWIGVGSKILKGVTIGDGCVIGANSVVTTNIPSYAIVGGVPARIIKYRE